MISCINNSVGLQGGLGFNIQLWIGINMENSFNLLGVVDEIASTRGVLMGAERQGEQINLGLGALKYLSIADTPGKGGLDSEQSLRLFQGTLYSTSRAFIHGI